MTVTRPLQDYHGKRDFTKTAEPKGTKPKEKAGRLRYVIQRHAASHLHFDFRLEHKGVLLSWAVPKGPSLSPDTKRLAMKVEDHPIEYGEFEGTIPEDQYGGGTVQLWDRGYWEPSEERSIDAGLKKGHLEFELDGTRLHGRWHLIRSKGSHYGKKGNAWLLIKGQDDHAVAGIRGDLSDIDQSVKTGRSVEEIAAGRTVEWHSDESVAKNVRRLKSEKPAASTGKPDFIPPQLALLREEPPEGADWAHEIKFDGYRVQLHVQAGRCTAYTRSGLDWSDRFPEIVMAAAKLPDCILDGEICVLDKDGITDFGALQGALRDGKTADLVFYAFDLLYAHSEDIRAKPLGARKETLRALLPASGERLRYSDHFTAPGAAVRSSACRMALEGIVSKKLKAPYRSGRGPGWIKSKCRGRQEFVVGGYVPSKSGAPVGSLLVGVHAEGELRYRGRVGAGLSPKVADELIDQLTAREQTKSPFIGTQPADKNGVVWLKPDLVAEIDYGGWSSDGLLRHAAFKGLREDKPAGEIIGEDEPVLLARSQVVLTHPEKLLWPEDQVTKQDLADYFWRMSGEILRYVGGRPLSIIRAPDGIAKQQFFQRHHMPGMSNFIRKSKVRAEKDPYITIEDADGLQALAQFNGIELHPWGATAAKPDKPEQLIFDLDPDIGVDFAMIQRAAFGMKAFLEDLGLHPFAKLSGGKGVHVVVPLIPSANWDQAKAFTRAVAERFAEIDPDHFVATMSKAKRVGKIFIDYLRNARTATAVAAWSPRARPGAPIAVPITWEFLESLKELPHYSMVKPKSWERHLSAWDGFDAARVKLSAAILKRLGV